jgi:hypothetical protein
MDEFHDNPCAAASDITVDSDSLILVDEDDRGVGHLSKAFVPAGPRHPASGIFIADF